jgi:alkanesulfonate monooxygenase
MEVGLQILDFTWPGGGAKLAGHLKRLAKAAEDAGIARISIMDHFWQLPHIGPLDHEVPEAYTVLGFLATNTEKALLHSMVTSVVYREPGLLAKLVSTLDVLSGGRAALGIGAGWNGEEAAGVGIAFPPAAERFERLEETIQICLQMWGPSEAPYEGTHYKLARTLNTPQILSTPRPRVIIGGGGERKTLRLVAKYADECNLFAGPDTGRKLDVLREHCDREGRDYDEIGKTAGMILTATVEVDPLLTELERLRDLGMNAVYVMIPGLPLEGIDVLGSKVIPEVAGW